MSDKYPLLLILHLACLSSSCDPVTCTYTSHIAEERESLQNKNTVKNELKALNALKNYLSEIGVENTVFSRLQKRNYIQTFWFNARTKDGDYYSAFGLWGLETHSEGQSRTPRLTME